MGVAGTLRYFGGKACADYRVRWWSQNFSKQNTSLHDVFLRQRTNLNALAAVNDSRVKLPRLEALGSILDYNTTRGANLLRLMNRWYLIFRCFIVTIP